MKRRWLPLLFTVCLLTGCKDQGLDGEYDQGITALEQQQYEEALEHFQALCEKEYRLSEAYRGSGIAYLESESYPEAIAAFSRSLNHMETQNLDFQKDVQYYLAESRMKYGEVNKAIQVYSDILKRGEDPQAFYLRGKAYMELGDSEKAASDFERSLKDCEDYDMYINIYSIYVDHGMETDGQKFLDMAMKKEPVTGEDFYHRGRIYEFKKDYANAKDSVSSSIDQGYEKAIPMMGHLYLLTDDVESAKAMYQKYLNTGAKKAAAYNGLAICAMQVEEYDEALDHIEQGLEENDPEVNQSLLYNEIICLEHKRQFNLAKDKMKQYLEQYPDDAEAQRENQFLSTR